MKIVLKNGDVVTIPFSRAGVAGFVCRSIELNGEDVLRMLEMLKADPREFEIHLRQLAARFDENRLFVDAANAKPVKPYECRTCGTSDKMRWNYCQHPMCPDGRDQS